MAHTCSECTYLDLDKEYSSGDGRFWCETRYEWHYASDAECWRYCTAYDRSSSTAKSYREYSSSKGDYTSPCFITTVVCEILGFKDNTKLLQILRKFRDEIMQKDEKYRSILAEYDIVGPIIARKIGNDKENFTLAASLFNTSLLSVFDFVQKKDYINALKMYQKMTNDLIEYYNINRQVSLSELEAMDIRKSGHGIYKKLSLNNV